MVQIPFNTGTTLHIDQLELYNLYMTEQLPMDEIRILVDTSVARFVFLPPSTNSPVRNIKITVVDVTGGAAVNNITVIAATGFSPIPADPSPNDSITGAPVDVINQAYQAVRYEHLSDNSWYVLSGSGGGGAGNYITNMTYNDLITNITNGTLIVGQQIVLLDYQTAHYIQYSGTLPSGVGNEQVHLGAIEPLLLTVIAGNQVSVFAHSTIYPTDIILYQPIMPDYDYDYCAAQGKGCIIHRTDSVANVSRDYDWRSVVFRRWETVPGNGNFWASEPVIGAASNDYLCFPVGTPASTTVLSPLNSALKIALGFPYWLDNTIIAVTDIAQNTLAVSVLNTYTEATAGAGTFYANEFGVNFGNVIVLDEISNNWVGVLSSNQAIASSPISRMVNNVSQNIASNVCDVIASNIVDAIGGNDVAQMVQNTGSVIGNNSMPAGNINRNIFATIKTNSNCLSISDNIANNIEDNTMSGSIDNNIVQVISLNTAGTVIQNNIVQQISGNSITAAISGNNLSGGITDNTAPVSNIINNTGGSIATNTNTGFIQANDAYLISGNSNTGDIGFNISKSINNNSALVTAIDENIVAYINNNSNVGTIHGNTGNSIANNTIKGKISGNSIQFINSNSTSGLRATDIESNFGAAIISCTLSNVNGVLNAGIKQCNNVRLNINTITDAIIIHTFLDGIGGLTITSNSLMWSGVTPNRSCWDTAAGKYKMMEVNNGVITFPTDIT